MSVRRRLVLGLFVVLAMFLVRGGAMAAVDRFDDDERFLSRTFDRVVRGDTIVDVDQELGLYSIRGRVNSVVLVASSRAGQGQVQLVVNGRAQEVEVLGTSLEAVQFHILRDQGMGLRDIKVRLRGNVTLALLGVTVDEEGRGRPVPPRPMPQPRRPVPMPGPGAPHGQFVSDAEFQSFVLRLQQLPFGRDQEKLLVIQNETFRFRGRLLTLRQADRVLEQLMSQEARLQALRALRTALFIDRQLVDDVLRNFTSPQLREEARRILLSVN